MHERSGERTSLNILLVGDDAFQQVVADAALRDLEATAVFANAGALALAHAGRDDFAIILVDAGATGLDAIAIARQLRATPRAAATPILFFVHSAALDELMRQAGQITAVDFIRLPTPPALLKARLAFFLELQRNRRRHDTREQRYQTLFDSMDEAVCFIEMRFDADGRADDYRFLETNPCFEQQTGLVNAVGQFMRTLAPAHEQHWFDMYGKVALTGLPVRVISEAKALGRWFDVYASRVGGPGSLEVAILFRDITARRHADEELRRLAEELAEADRRKSEFLATLAHELRNPLAPIRSGLEILRLDPLPPAALPKVRDMMGRQVAHMVHLINDLLDVARITHGNIDLRAEPVPLATVVDNAIETSLPLIEAGGHALSVQLPDPPVTLLADRVRLAQVISNLLNNAAKYTPAGGRIALDAHVDGDMLDIAVRDNGIGIAAESLPEVFEMFAQLGRGMGRAQGGLGIGLTLVRQLAQLRGGTVAAHSEGKGLGSTFTVRLPLPAPGEAA